MLDEATGPGGREERSGCWQRVALRRTACYLPEEARCADAGAVLCRQPRPHAPPTRTPSKDSTVVASMVQQLEQRQSSSLSLFAIATPSTDNELTKPMGPRPAGSTPQAFRERWHGRSPPAHTGLGASPAGRGRQGASSAQEARWRVGSSRAEPLARSDLSLPDKSPLLISEAGRERTTSETSPLHHSADHPDDHPDGCYHGVLSYRMRPSTAAETDGPGGLPVALHLEEHHPRPTWC